MLPKFKTPRILAVLLLASFSLQAADRPVKPNVVLILTDDLGWQDVGCYDIDEANPFETPNIDRLAKEGLQFWQGYSPAPTCAPTRVAILTGKHPARSQKTHVVGGAPPTPYSKRSPLISPWYSGRLEMSETTLAEALKAGGYKTGCVGKWHCAISHPAFPRPEDQGFGYSRMNVGTTRRMENRLKGFATDAKDDPYRLDEDGFPFDENTEDALNFLRENQGDPFFLYYATWLVHTPIHSRSEALLRKYCEKMNVPFPENPDGWPIEGQKNPYYGAMVESLDHYVGQVVGYLEKTEDPRWPGHKLVENTFVIFTSDNGGMERMPGEEITDNYPLDKGKINAKEGGVRVPLIIKGPGLPTGKESSAMVNGIDFYPTILTWTNTPRPDGQHLDGVDLSPYLAGGATDAKLLTDQNGKARDTMVWHFPHSSMQSTIRQGNYKLIRNWQPYLLGKEPALELFKLYEDGGSQQRVDIEEAKNLSGAMPEKAREMNEELERRLDEMKASPPYLNPNFQPPLPHQKSVCKPIDHGREGKKVWLTFRENGAAVTKAQLIYTNNGGENYEEWFRAPAELVGEGRAEAELPQDATHYLWNLIDENHFLVSHPEMPTETESAGHYSKQAFPVER